MSWLGLDRDHPKLNKFSQILIMREPLVVQFRSVNLVSWLGLDRDLPKLRELKQILTLRELSVVISWKLEILFPPISLFEGLLVNFPVVTVEKGLIADFMVVRYITMQHLDLSGLKIKYLLVPVRPLWARNVLSSGFMTLLALR